MPVCKQCGRASMLYGSLYFDKYKNGNWKVKCKKCLEKKKPSRYIPKVFGQRLTAAEERYFNLESIRARFRLWCKTGEFK